MWVISVDKWGSTPIDTWGKKAERACWKVIYCKGFTGGVLSRKSHSTISEVQEKFL